MDSLSAILNIGVVQLISNITPETYLDPKKKDVIDYFVISVLCICWLRFFCYFLVIRDISKLVLTLISMIGDTLNFMFLMGCFIIIMASIFTTLYQDTNPEKYGSFAITVRYMFDAAIASYDYDNMGSRVVSHSILIMFHTFISNVMLLNYLIAILSTTYENMKQTGIFYYKVNLYQYCERFQIAFNDAAYGEIVLHPPPLSYMTATLIPFLVSPVAMKHMTKAYSYILFWVENTVLIGGFLFFEIFIFPIAYLKVWINIIRNSIGTFKKICNSFIIAVLGIFILFFIMMRDVYYLCRILLYHQGCREGQGLIEKEDEGIDAETKVKVYNEIRATVIHLFKKLQKHMRQNQRQGSDSEFEEENEEDDADNIDYFYIEDDEHMNEDFLYVVKKSLIIEEWKKKKFQMERQRRLIA